MASNFINTHKDIDYSNCGPKKKKKEERFWGHIRKQSKPLWLQMTIQNQVLVAI